MTLNQLFDAKYLPHATRTLKPRTVAEYTRLARVFVLPQFGEREIAGLALEDAEKLHTSVPGAVQANRVVAVLSAMLTYAADRRLLPMNPCRGVERNKEKGREFFYNKAQCQRILAAALSFPDVRGKYIALGMLTGARPGELIQMTPAWCVKDAIRTPDGKTGGRVIYLSPAARRIVDSLPEPTGADGRYFPADMDLRRAWDRIVREAKVPRARLYDLRHTFASAALANDVSLDVIGMMLGHRKRETTLRYAHLSAEAGANAAAAAAASMGAK
jgi:integrase